MTKRILNVVSNVAHYDDPAEPTGLWLSELTHAYDVFAEAGYEQTIVSPKGGTSPLEPRSLKFPSFGKSAKAWKADDTKMALLARTAAPDEIDSTAYDAIYFTGGHAVMYDFPDCEGLQRITREIFERGESCPRSATATAACSTPSCRTDRSWSPGASSPGSPGRRRSWPGSTSWCLITPKRKSRSAAPATLRV